jgi:hypothetical protein
MSVDKKVTFYKTTCGTVNKVDFDMTDIKCCPKKEFFDIMAICVINKVEFDMTDKKCGQATQN